MNKVSYLYELSEQDGIYSKAYNQFGDNLFKRLETIKKYPVNYAGDNPLYLQQLLICAEKLSEDSTEEVLIKPYELTDLLKGIICAIEHLPADIIINKAGICRYIQSHIEEFLNKLLKKESLQKCYENYYTIK
ncbi:MAG TPA: hypothetical protein PKK61_14820 [Defluviitaleaceae bacterium]|mgnify:CR=1 FL=1|jgi:hypothetical protein|nr:hypothetical protein [Candidatus Epulonipiscium sp.]HOA82314.1 hypothetical protein [Defluviitaleaceae bacterium]